MSSGKKEVKHGGFVKFISLAKDYFKESYKSQNEIHFLQPQFTLGIIQIKVKNVLKGVNFWRQRMH